MADDKPSTSRSKAALGGKAEEKKEEAVKRELRRMSLERTANGYIKATHQYDGDGKEEIHAMPAAGFFDHLGQAFNLSNEKKALDAKQSNVKAYETEHGALATSPRQPTASAAPKAPDQYDKIRANLRAKAAQPPASMQALTDRFEALIGK